LAILAKRAGVLLVYPRLNGPIRAELLSFNHIVLSRYLHLLSLDAKHGVDKFLVLVSYELHICRQLQILSLQRIYLILQEINLLILLTQLVLKRYYCFSEKSEIGGKCLESFRI
jgi:hypothetical protein